MRVLLGIAIATALVITAWSIDPTVGKTRRALRIDPTGMMTTAADQNNSMRSNLRRHKADTVHRRSRQFVSRPSDI
jgi:hypothetical protein